MKNARDLSHEQLVSVVDQVQQILYLNANAQGMIWDPNKEWDCETIEYVAGVLSDSCLKPERAMPREPPVADTPVLINHQVEAMLPTTIRNIRKLDGEETLKGTITILGVEHHIEFVRVHEQGGLQVSVGDPHGRFAELQQLYDGYYETVRGPGFEGEYAVSVVPYAH